MRGCIEKSETIRVYRGVLSAEISQTHEILRRRDAGVIPIPGGLSAARAFVSFAAVTAFTGACMAQPDYSYAIAFYDRLGALARFHETSNRCHNHPGNVLGPRTAFPASRKPAVARSRYCSCSESRCKLVSFEYRYVRRIWRKLMRSMIKKFRDENYFFAEGRERCALLGIGVPNTL